MTTCAVRVEAARRAQEIDNARPKGGIVKKIREKDAFGRFFRDVRAEESQPARLPRLSCDMFRARMRGRYRVSGLSRRAM